MHYLKKIILGSNAKSLGLPILGNERGILTLDFIFAMLMMFCFSAIIFAFTITFSAVEIAQYATYASARAFFAARKTSDEQEKAGKDKFTALVLNPKAQLGTFFAMAGLHLPQYKSKILAMNILMMPITTRTRLSAHAPPSSRNY